MNSKHDIAWRDPRAEAHRNKIFAYIEKLIKHVARKELDPPLEEVYVQRFGSVPLKTYLPHGQLFLKSLSAQ